jgi:solute carrier family 13 (sodium-dependent dicarboxylate transporter), member 2/3/5
MMNEPQGRISDREARFEQFRRRVGFFLAPLVCLGLWWLPIPALSPPAHRLVAILGLTVTFWITEAIPLPAAALLGPVLCVVAGIDSAKEVFKSFADPIIFMFLGSFIIAEAMLHHGLNRRIAFGILGLKAVGDHPERLLLAFGGITGLLSMWISNTATTAMMFPIGLAILREMAQRQTERTGQPCDFTAMRFSTGLMLMTAFGASVGGLATPVGTPPNLIGLGFIREQLGLHIPFFQWMTFGLPLAGILIAFLGFYLNRVCPAAPSLLEGGEDWIRLEKSKLGPLRSGEWNVLIAFGATVTLWVLPGAMALTLGQAAPIYLWLREHLPESMVALLGALTLFLLPVRWTPFEATLSWRQASRIDWGTILLFGGGLALGSLMSRTGLAEWIGNGLAHALQAKTVFSLTVVFTAGAILVSETTSNAASATMVVPVAIAVAQAAGVPPLQPALAACLGASMGFMLPVSTPPNAIVYGSGCVPIGRMVRYGLLLDFAGGVVIIGIVTWLVPLVLSAK